MSLRAVVVGLVFSSVLAACGGGSSPSGGNTFTVGGTVSGLVGGVVVLVNGDADPLEAGNGTFTFSTPLAEGAPYDVKIRAQPKGQTCSVAGGVGRATANVTSVVVTCAPNVRIGGQVTGLVGTLTLANLGGDTLTVTSNGTFWFPTAVSVGSTFAVTVSGQPQSQICLVDGGSGTALSDVTTVSVACRDETYRLSGVVTGLSGSVTLRADVEEVVVTANGAFAFPTWAPRGTAYTITVAVQPLGQTCVVTNGTGTALAEVTNITVTCTTNTYSIGGMVTGLTGALVLKNGSELLTRTVDGSFSFAGKVSHGASYQVTVATQPDGQFCSVQSGSGTATAEVTSVVVTCAATTITIGGTVSGLVGSLELLLNGNEWLSLTADGPFTFPTGLLYGAIYDVNVASQPDGQTCVVAGGVGTALADVTNVSVTCALKTYVIGGTASGLVGTVRLRNNGADDLDVTTNGSFAFAGKVGHGSGYSVTVVSMPAGQRCTLANAAGTATANVGNLVLTCAAEQYQLGGTITGLVGSVSLQNNGGDTIVVGASGTFTFPTRVAHGGGYAVTVSSQPSGQTCTVARGSGTITADVSDIAVTCAARTYQLGGVVTGVVGSLSLQNNGGDTVVVSADGSFSFPTRVTHGATYSVTVSSAPAAQTCTVARGSGTMAADALDVAVTCTMKTYQLAGTVSGLVGSVSLQNNGADTVVVSADGGFTFPTRVTHGAPYSVTVLSAPAAQTCTVSNGGGTMTADVVDVAVTCTTKTYLLGGTVSGLVGSVSLQNNGGDTLVVSANGSFSFPTRVAHGATYLVTVASNPVGQTCSVSFWGSGTMTADVGYVNVTCETARWKVTLSVSGLVGTVWGDFDGIAMVATKDGLVDGGTWLHGTPYDFVITKQPTNQVCTFKNGTGVVTADVLIEITCVDLVTIRGSVAGLVGSVTLQDNATDSLTLSANGSFTFPSRIPSGQSYDVTVLEQPAAQTCTVRFPRGQAGIDSGYVEVTCASSTQSLGGTVTGLSGSVTLQNWRTEDVVVSTDGPYVFPSRVASGSSYNVLVSVQPAGQTCTVANPTGRAVADVSDIDVTCADVTYAIGGAISGSGGGYVTVRNRDGATLDVHGDGTFTFPRVAAGFSYDVTVIRAPLRTLCSVTGGKGTALADVTSIAVTCAPAFPVGGSVSGLVGTVTLQDAVAGTIVVTRNGTFMLPSLVPAGASYDVSVSAQPAGQTCAVTNGTGTVSADVTSVVVSCHDNFHTVGGGVSGLNGSVTLENNAGDPLVLVADGAFEFATPVAHDTIYDVTVAQQPVGQTCTVTRAAGTALADVTDVSVTCEVNTYAIGGTVSGLVSPVTLYAGSTAGAVTVKANGSFTFPYALRHGTTYDVSVLTQPTGQTCTVSQGSGTATAPVTDVQVTCTTNTYVVGGHVDYLVGTIELQNNGTDTITVSASGTFAFPTPLPYGTTFEVTVLNQPATRTCTVAWPRGTVTATVSSVAVTCSTATHTIGGTVHGLSGSVTLQNTGADDLVLTGDGPFAFPSPVATNGEYRVSVAAQPAGQTCTVGYPGGWVAGSDVTNIAVYCAADTYTLGGTVSGTLPSTAVHLSDNVGWSGFVGKGPFTLSRVASGFVYAVAMYSASNEERCTLTNGNGTVTADVTNITVTCQPAYTIGGTVSGLGVGKDLSLRNNGSDTTYVSANGTFTMNTRLVAGEAYDVTVFGAPSGQRCTVAGGKGTVSGTVTDVVVTCVPDTYVIRGTVSGLSGTVSLQNNGADTLAVSANGSFAFATPLAPGASYAVTVSSQPAGQICTVSRGSGTVGTADVTDVSVVCSGTTYTIGGTISGLTGSVSLQNNSGDTLVCNANGAFTFATPVAASANYAVTVSSQPTGQICKVTNGTGTATGNVSTVSVTCGNAYTVGGTISGLTGTVSLQNNGGDTLVRGGDGPFSFATPVAAGSSYAVTVSSQPAGQTCAVTGGTGTATANVTSVTVTCAATTYSIGGTVSGLTGTVSLQNNGGDTLVRNADGPFTFSARIAAGSTYAVTVSSQPTGQTCVVAGGTGTASGDVTTVAITCAAATYGISGTVSGLSGTLILENNGTDSLVRTANGPFTFATKVTTGSFYSVTVASQPVGQVCSVTNGFGVVATDVTTVSVTCAGAGAALDPTFGTNGVSVVSLSTAGDVINDIGLQSDGKVIAVGNVQGTDSDFSISRFLTDGTLDTSFATGGTLIGGFEAGIDAAYGVAIQGDDKIVAVGTATQSGAQRLAVVRLNANGTLDTSFATTGRLVLAVPGRGSNDVAKAVAIQGDGKIVIGGYSSSDALVLRLNTDGTVDTSFGASGFALPAVSTTTDAIQAMALQSDGKIVVAGYGSDGSGAQQVLVARLTTAGALDPTFNTTGFALDTVASLSMGGAAVALDSAGRAVTCGATQESTARGFLSRRTNAGALDNAFDTDGWQLADAGGTARVGLLDLVVLGDGKLLAVGSAGDAMLVARYTSAGTLDTTFEGDGVGLYSAGFGASMLTSIAVQPDGKYLAAGATMDGSVNHSTLIRVSP